MSVMLVVRTVTELHARRKRRPRRPLCNEPSPLRPYLSQVIVISYGMIALHEPAGPFAVGGCLLTLLGGVWYALVRRNLGKKAEAEKANAEAEQAPAQLGTKAGSCSCFC